MEGLLSPKLSPSSSASLAVQARSVALISLRNLDRFRVVGLPVGVSSSVTLVQRVRIRRNDALSGSFVLPDSAGPEG